MTTDRIARAIAFALLALVILAAVDDVAARAFLLLVYVKPMDHYARLRRAIVA
jgi:hypothetical protein